MVRDIPFELPGDILATLVSAADAKAHLIESIVQEHTLYTNISGESNTLKSWTFNADDQYRCSRDRGGTDSENISIQFDSGTFTFTSTDDSLVFNNDSGLKIEIKEIQTDYMTIVIDDGVETRLYYDEAKARAYFLN